VFSEVVEEESEEDWLFMDWPIFMAAFLVFSMALRTVSI
jgi:hypothetical protein